MRVVPSKVMLVLLTAAFAATVVAVLVWIKSEQRKSKLSQVEGRFSQLELALHNYYLEHKSFPPSDLSPTPDSPRHSWRVLLLPYLDLSNFLQQYSLKESWDSEHNLKLSSQLGEAPMYYRSPFSEQQTSLKADYFLLNSDKAELFRQRRLRIHHVTVGQQVLIIVEVPNSQIHWTAPLLPSELE